MPHIPFDHSAPGGVVGGPTGDWRVVRPLSDGWSDRCLTGGPTGVWRGARRVHNMGMPVTDTMSNVFRGADLEVQLNMLARQAAARLPATSLPDTRRKVPPPHTLHTRTHTCPPARPPALLSSALSSSASADFAPSLVVGEVLPNDPLLAAE